MVTEKELTKNIFRYNFGNFSCHIKINMSYLEPRPRQTLVEPKSRRAYPIVLAITFVIIVIIIIILIIIFTRRSTSTVKCTSDSNCSGATPKCNTSTGTCVGCLANSDCPSGKVCTNGNNCVNKTCQSNSDCSGSTPICNTGNGLCVQCLQASDCSVSGSTCNANGQCVSPCTGPPNTVTNVQAIGHAGTTVISWTPPSGGQPIANYIVTRAHTNCSNAVAETQTVPFGTNQVPFNNLNPGNDCYRVQSSNACGTTLLSSAPSAIGITCGVQPVPFPDANTGYTISPNCTQHAPTACSGTAADCPCQCIGGTCMTCAPNDFICQANDNCSGPICPSGNPSTTCFVSINWQGPFTTSNQMITFTRQQVTDSTGTITLLDNEATLSYTLQPGSTVSAPINWHQKCGLTTTVHSIFVQNVIEANVDQPAIGTTGGPVNLPPNPTFVWDTIPGADEYTITVTNGTLNYGTVVDSTTAQINANNLGSPGKAAYTFISANFATTNAAVHIYGYSLCDKSQPSSPGSSVTS